MHKKLMLYAFGLLAAAAAGALAISAVFPSAAWDSRGGLPEPVILAILVNSANAAQETGGAEQVAFNNHCRTCHSSKPDDNRLGPSLFGVFGRKAASMQGYSYSDAMKNSGLTWDEGALDKFIADPEAVVPGNGMKPFTGVGNPQERASIIAFLRNTH
jgi:cytochrome c